jgi:hypothetical protein
LPGGLPAVADQVGNWSPSTPGGRAARRANYQSWQRPAPSELRYWQAARQRAVRTIASPTRLEARHVST